MILFFFAGHGAEVTKSPYLLTSDTKLSVLRDTSVDVSEINTKLESSKAGRILRIFDACRSPFGNGRGISDGRMSDGLQQAMLKSAIGWASFSSCSSGESAHESSEFEQGIFSYYLCEGLEGKAADDNGEITFDKLVDYVKLSMRNWSDEKSRQQTPHIQADLSGVLILSNKDSSTNTTATVPNSPLLRLYSGIDAHLERIPEDIRNLTFTTEDEQGIVFNLLKNLLQPKLATHHKSLPISITVKRIQELDRQTRLLWSDIKKKNFESELKDYSGAIQINFDSQEVTIPSTAITVVIARFSFFYWLWYSHECSQQQLQGSFNFKPSIKKGYWVLTPKAGVNNLKVDNIIDELITHITANILDWTQQLGEFVDGKFASMRLDGQIIK